MTPESKRFNESLENQLPSATRWRPSDLECASEVSELQHEVRVTRAEIFRVFRKVKCSAADM